jgi:hypothetical protein
MYKQYLNLRFAIMWSAALIFDNVRSLSVQSALKVGKKALNLASGIRSRFKVICTTSRFMREKNMVISPSELGTTNNCANEDQQQFTRPDPK